MSIAVFGDTLIKALAAAGEPGAAQLAAVAVQALHSTLSQQEHEIHQLKSRVEALEAKLTVRRS